ncbi:HAD-IA family hydrolase [Roseospirillum parvum]|uniref:Phosphoglycolate phosphatase n=1 Tax=Roseospirillum parvum TaxID=83401 RepID=A0A1G7Z9U1_9PROT|nr:HAD-IA family hydrolase [Roseospirillum parvum]SDH05369.1 phosphoglycolate phosphatase [Roseospirillum parvum]
MGSLTLVAFDVDGTLIDSQGTIVLAMERAFEGHGLAVPPPAAVRGVIGLSLPEAIGRLLPEDAPPALAEALSADYRAAFFELRQAGAPDPLFPGAAQALVRAARAGHLLALVTGKSRRGVTALLERPDVQALGVSIDAIATADDGPGKPDPFLLRKAMADVGVDPAFTLMVGDTTYDMEMAVRAGVPAVGVSWGYHAPQALAAAGAGRVIDRFEELSFDDLPAGRRMLGETHPA